MHPGVCAPVSRAHAALTPHCELLGAGAWLDPLFEATLWGVFLILFLYFELAYVSHKIKIAGVMPVVNSGHPASVRGWSTFYSHSTTEAFGSRTGRGEGTCRAHLARATPPSLSHGTPRQKPAARTQPLSL